MSVRISRKERSMEKDLHTYLSEYSAEARIPMHMPGHKRRGAIVPYMQIDASLDYTELDYTDNLHAPTGVLKSSMELAAKLWGSRESFYLVNGSSCGILAGIRTLTRRGDKVLVCRNAHKSVYHAIELCGLKPVFALPEAVDGFGVCGSVTPAQIEAAFAAHGDIVLVIVTSPTYEGVLSDICQIADAVHQHGAALLVDEAHGAHLGLNPAFEKGAVQCGADLVVQSLHKTLPVFTQTAILHVCSERVDLKRLSHQLAVFETSSPSYPLLISADGCVRKMTQDKTWFDAWLVGLAGFSIWAQQLEYLSVLGYGENLPEQVYAFDQSKIYISTHACNLTGPQLAARLSEYKIDVEMVCAEGVLAMTGAGDSIESVSILAEALLEIDRDCSSKKKTAAQAVLLPEMVLLPETALEAEFACRTIAESEGEVCAEYIWAYPPGIPILIPGERIAREHVQHISKLLGSGIELHKSRSEKNDEIAVIAS